MNKNNFILVFVIFIFFSSSNSYAQLINKQRAHFNYMMLCQGCHQADAGGVDDNVPRMKGYIGYFLQVEGGREFLVRVPGSANAAIDDAQLTELLNWIIIEFAGSSLPKDFTYFTEMEVATLRKSPLNEVEHFRANLVKKISALQNDSR